MESKSGETNYMVVLSYLYFKTDTEISDTVSLLIFHSMDGI